MSKVKKAPAKLYKQLQYFRDSARLFENAAMQTQNDKDNAANYHRWADRKQAEIDEIENKQ